MNNGLITIVDSEESYAVRLADYFRAKSGLGYNVRVFTSIDSFLAFEKTTYTDILIISDVYGGCIADLTNIGQIYILSEGSVDISLREYSCIYKYQSTENIIRDVMTGYSAIVSPKCRITLQSACTNIISVYSPVKRCGKTTFALVFGAILAKKEDTLYISLEEYSSLSFYTRETSVGDLSDLLYFYRQNPENLDKKLLSLSHSLHKLDYIPPMRFSLDLKCMSGEDWRSFIKAIAALSGYRNIIIDISDSITDIFALLEMSDTVYFPILDDAISAEKIANFKRTAQSLGKGELIEKLREITLPGLTVSSSDSDAFGGLLYGSYGSSVSKIVDEYDK